MQNGNILVTFNGGNSFTNATNGIDDNDRRNWDMPYIMSPHDPTILYSGTHRVYKGIGFNPQWTPISEDLTDGPIEPHLYHNISALDESKLVPGLLYAGTGDGNVWRKDEGTDNWTPIVGGLPDQYVTDVKPSLFFPDVVFVTHSGYRDNDFIPHIHRSADRGETWTDISANLPELAINDLLILPGHGDSILFVATDGGIYGTLDAGSYWERLGNNMPIMPSYDLALNVEKNELIAGTFARSLMTYPIDSLQEGGGTTTSQIEPELIQADKIKAYPNPARSYINVGIQNVELGYQIEMQILNSVGQVVYQFNEQANVLNKRIPISTWSDGTYFIKVKIRDQTYMKTFIKLS